MPEGSASFIPFNRPYLVGTETGYIEEAVGLGWLASGGAFSMRCREWLRERTGADAVMLTNSCTDALEASALLARIGPGDEVIMPSFTFVTTATAFALRGAKPVFVDIGPETLNVDPARVEDAISDRTRAIVVMHYAGVGCEMAVLSAIAQDHRLILIEDAAQGLLASYGDSPLGSIGALGTISFHETKNVTCGEGGALLINDPELRERAEIICEKGTNRSRFNRGQVDKYTWVDLGSSFLASEVSAAFLWGQLEAADEITNKRMAIWEAYDQAFADLERSALVRRPVIPEGCAHNAHMYYLLLPDEEHRMRFIDALGHREILAVFHYVPLHSSEAGTRLGRPHGDMANTDELSARLVRLPLWPGMSEEQVERVIAATRDAASRV